LLAGAHVLSMLLKTSSSRGDSWSAEEYTRPRGTLSRKNNDKIWFCTFFFNQLIDLSFGFATTRTRKNSFH
jgi:hypothetical protein